MTTGTVAAYKSAGYAAAIDARDEYDRLEAAIHATRPRAAKVDPDTGLAVVDTSESRIKSIAGAAARKYAETGDSAAAMAELFAGVERTRV